MATDIVFTCPKCGSHKIEEIMVDMTVVSEMTISEHEDETGPGGIFTNYGEQENDGGHVDRYQCGECGKTIVDHDSPHSIDGLDAGALAKAIKFLNANEPEPGVILITHAELVRRFADALRVTECEVLARIWNEESPNAVKYVGDSMFEWLE